MIYFYHNKIKRSDFYLHDLTKINLNYLELSEKHNRNKTKQSQKSSESTTTKQKYSPWRHNLQGRNARLPWKRLP